MSDPSQPRTTPPPVEEPPQQAQAPDPESPAQRAKAPPTARIARKRSAKPPEEEDNAEPIVQHALQIALANPRGFLKIAVGLTASVLGLLLLTAFLIAEFLICNDIIIPGVYSVSAKTNQVVVPAAAGWVAVNPEVAFEKGTTIKFKVSGRVHLGIHEVVDLAKFRGPLTPDPPTVPDPLNVSCSEAKTYLASLGAWRHPWRDVTYRTAADTDKCRLSPFQAGGRLVYAVLATPPRGEHLGVNHLDASVKEKGVLDSETTITLAQDGYIILAVNDRLDCDDSFQTKRDKLRAYLQSVSSCQLENGKPPSSLYDLDDDLMRSATIADNEGEYFVHLTVD